MKLSQLIAMRILALSNERGWTQYKLATRSGIPDSTLSYVLKSKGISITTETLLNICRGLNMRLAEFFDDKMFDFENISDD